MTSRDMHDNNSINNSNKKTPVVDELLELLEREKEENFDESMVRDLITDLSSNASNYVLDDTSSSSLFDPLLGYYNVSYTITSRPNDNPVGGKWTRGLWTVKRTLQHVLPPLSEKPSEIKRSNKVDGQDGSFSVASKSVAQVINAIRLELLWGFVNVWVLLRGDAVPLKLDPMYGDSKDDSELDDTKKKAVKLLPNLSDRTVKAYFDRPRIGVSVRGGKNSKLLFKRVMSLGPTSAVVLDTPYADNRIRLARGGVSGAQFVFSRVSETDKEAMEGWKWVLKENANKGGSSLKKTIGLRLALFGVAISLVSTVMQQRWMKMLTRVYAVIATISIFGLIRSTGGIEKDDMYMKGLK
eukprot:CAMPEP_0197194408 /NCGR_PEP_ID=MMETSP1423-20130617/29186_1 /TAXON_ID=476441 /ORGANISM="Pseudo-nitzschia heimii, Strain UNC1101" /LENGTH=353 /DNA_ID=CAMNT_0042647827 /DNA_START=252 /DNA_END=1313 /DNA_ORIENTATION=-